MKPLNIFLDHYYVPYVIRIYHNSNPRLLRHNLVVELDDTFKLMEIQRELQLVIVQRVRARAFDVHGDERTVELNFPKP